MGKWISDVMHALVFYKRLRNGIDVVMVTRFGPTSSSVLCDRFAENEVAMIWRGFDAGGIEWEVNCYLDESERGYNGEVKISEAG